jgi:PAS domain S-box-containing protein
MATLVAAVLLRQLLDPLMGETLPLVTLFGAIAVAVWIGGYRPAILVAALGYLAFAYLFIEPRGTIDLATTKNVVGLVAYIFTSSIIISFGHLLLKARRRAELAGERLHITISSVGDAVITTDAQGGVAALNPVAEALTGWTHDDAKGKPLETVFNIINEQTRERVENPVEKVLRLGRVVGLANHTVLVAKDGSERAIDDSAAPIRDRQGQTLGVVLVFHDVTDRRKAERTLRESEARKSAMFHTALDAIITIDQEGKVLEFNRTAEDIFGHRSDDVLGQELAELIVPPGLRERHRRGMAHYLATGEGPVLNRRIELPAVRANGEEFQVELAVTPIQLDGLLIFTAYIRDITERRRLEQENIERMKAARFLASIVESSDDAIISKSLSGIIQTWNAAAARLFGYSPIEAVGRPVTMLIPPERIAEENEIIASIVRGERVDHFETVRLRKDGRPIPVSLTISPILDDRGKIIGASKIVRDITEREHLTRAERESRELLHATLVGIGDAVIATNDQGRIAFLNPIAANLTGWTEQEAKGQPLTKVFQIINETTRKEVDNPALRALKEGTIVGLANHTVLIAKDGTERPIDDSAAPIRNADGSVSGAVLVFRDITERRKAHDAMRRSEERLRQAQQVANIGTFEWNIQSGVNLWTPELEAMYGLKPGEFAGTYESWEQLIHPDDRAETIERAQVALESGSFQAEWRAVWADGSVHWLAGRASVFRDQDGKPLRLLGVNIDITARKEAEGELRRVAAELSEADRRKDEFLATLAHELRNPLAPLRNGLQIMRLSGDSPETVQQTRTMMERQLTQMVRLVDDLLDLSRISRGTVELRKERVPLLAVIQSALETSGPIMATAGHELTIDLPKEPILVDADLTRLSQVFGNLLNNAAKYTERGGHVWLSALKQGDEVVVSVRDTGIGIPVEMLPRVFEMFTQIDRNLERSQGGLGIGLTLSKRLVELHGGTIEAKSEGERKGSTFTVRLPLVEIGEDARPTFTPAEAATSKPSRRILVADDNVDAADSLARMLKMMGHDVRTANDGAESIAIANDFKPDLVFLDIGMPKLNGYEACRKIKEKSWTESTVFVALTGWGQDEDKRKAREAGFDQHLTKPVDYSTLEKLFSETKNK